MISHFLRKLLAEHSVGLEQQHQNQQSKGEGVAEDSDRVIRLDQRFTDTDYICAEDSPGEPMPPKTAATKALSPGMAPMVGLT